MTSTLWRNERRASKGEDSKCRESELPQQDDDSEEEAPSMKEPFEELDEVDRRLQAGPRIKRLRG